MKKIIAVALYLLISIGMYSQDMKDVYLSEIKKSLEKGNCEKAELVYKVAIECKVLKADADIEARIAECSQDMKDVYKNGIKNNLEKGNCEKAEEVYKVAIENKVLKADADIEARIAECKSAANVSQAPQQTPSSPKMSEPKATRGTINGHEYVDLGLSVKWATCNIGANFPDNPGKHYAWGETSTKASYTFSNSRTYGANKRDIAGNSRYDVARVSWGGTWRLPTKEEFEELINCCTWESTKQNGVDGYKVTSRYNGKSIFLPAAGNRDESSLNYAGSLGFYWSSSPYKISFAYNLYFNSSEYEVDWEFRSYGCSVRAVSE